MMNKYETITTTTCPTNGSIVEIHIVIVSCHAIMVEDLQEFLKENLTSYHEVLADKLHKRFGGKQILTGFHHGVWITTERG